MNELPSMSADVLALNPELRQASGTGNSASKYHNAKAEAHGMTFASGHEAAVISGLILAEQQHKIFGLRLQVRFPLQGGVVYVADAPKDSGTGPTSTRRSSSRHSTGGLSRNYE
jgi:hypothetical protein